MLAYAIGFPEDSLIIQREAGRDICVPVTTQEWNGREARFKIFCGDRPNLFPRLGQMTSWVVVGGQWWKRLLAVVKGAEATYASPRNIAEAKTILANVSSRYHY